MYICIYIYVYIYIYTVLMIYFLGTSLSIACLILLTQGGNPPCFSFAI